VSNVASTFRDHVHDVIRIVLMVCDQALNLDKTMERVRLYTTFLRSECECQSRLKRLAVK
jgi:hypothetical protein